MLDTVTEALAKILQYIWHALFQVPYEYWKDWIEKVLETAALFWAKALSKQILKFSSNFSAPGDMPEGIKTTIDGLLKAGDLGSLAAGVFYLIPWLAGYVSNTWGVINRDVIKHVLATYLPEIPPLDQLIPLLWRHPDRVKELQVFWQQLGFSDDQKDNIEKAMKPIMDVSSLLQLLHRGKIDTKRFDAGCKAHGYSVDEIEQFKELGWYIPGVPDLVHMAVREVFTPEVVEKYGQMQDFPSDFAVQAKKQGVSEYWAKNFWADHWILPSMGMGYEMLHRGVIEEDDLDVLMRSQDIMPYWRSRLKAISYRPYSRVDVRRMYGLGVLKKEDVKKAYKDIGYDEEKASKMTEFTVKYQVKREKDLSKTELLDALRKDLLSKAECEAKLKEMGYDKDEYSILIDRVLFEKEEEFKDLSMGYVKAMYVNKIFSYNEAIDSLGKLNLGSPEQENIIKLWDVQRETKVKRLTASELKQLLTSNVITPDSWSTEMAKLHYSSKSIAWLRELLIGKDQVEEVKDLSVSQIKQLFLSGIYSDKEATRQLTRLDYGVNEQGALIQLWTAKKQELASKEERAIIEAQEILVRDLSESNIKQLFLKEVYTENEAITALAKLNLGAVEIEDLVILWSLLKIEAKAKEDAAVIRIADLATRELGIGDIKKIYKAGIYTEEEAKEHLRMIKLPEPEIEDLIELWNQALLGQEEEAPD